MEKVILDQIRKKLERKEIIDEELLYKYLREIISMEGVGDYIQNFSVNQYGVTGYNILTSNLSFCINEILYERSNKKVPNIQDMISWIEIKNRKIENINAINIYNIILGPHEVSHATQHSLEVLSSDMKGELDDFSKLRLDLIEKSNILGFLSEKIYNDYYYDQFHDYFFSEYDADINAYLQSLRIFELLDVKEIIKDIQLVNRIIAKKLLYLYIDINSRKKKSSFYLNFLYLYNLITKIAKNEGIEIPNLDYEIYDEIEEPENQIDRLRLGFSLSDDTFNYLNQVAKSKHKTLNLFDDIRNI